MNPGRRRALDALRRWWWALLLLPLVAGLGARAVDAWLDDDEPSYSATALLLVAETGQSDYSATTYRELLLTTAVLEPVVSRLDLPFDVGALKDRVHADPVVGPNDQPTELLSVRAVDDDPQRAAEIANAVAESFVAYVSDRSNRLTDAMGAATDEEIAATRQQITDTQQKLRLLEQGPDSADPSTREQIEELRSSLRDLQQELNEQLQAAQAPTTDGGIVVDHVEVSIADEAVAPDEPDAAEGIDPVVPAAAVGFLLAVAVIAGVSYFDTTIRSAAEVEALTGTPLLGIVPRVARLRPGRAQMFTVAQPRSAAADAIRQIRTTLEFATSERITTTVVVSSPGPGEGKSTIAVSLAAAVAQTMRTVMVIDADLRRPSLHSALGVRNERGLSTLLARPDQPWWTAAIPTTIPRLSLIPSGPIPPNPSDLLSLDRLPQLLDEIADSVDVILIDTPPLLLASDALDVAANADGVILVCRADRTRRGRLESAVTRLRQGNLRLIGAVLSHQRRRESTYGYGYPPATQSDASTEGTDTLIGPPLMHRVEEGAAPIVVEGDWEVRPNMLGPGTGGASPLPAFD